jgi:hypothetical protein
MPGLRRPSIQAVAIALATLLATFGAATNALVNLTHQTAPEVALALNGDDPVALIRKAQVDLAAGTLPPGGNRALLDIVRRSIAQAPLNAPALRLYGLSSAANSDLPGVRAQMAVSDRIERRDAATQLWLIEDAVNRNDVSAALRHYDTALRIEQSTRTVLYPVLTDALQSPVIRQRFARYLDAPPPWLESFLRFAVSNTREPTAIADLARIAGGFPDGGAYSSLDRELLTQLVAFKEFPAAIAHYRRIKGAPKAVTGALDLTQASTDQAFAPVTWQPFSIEGIETFLLAAPPGEGAVEIEAEMVAGYKGSVARKLLALKPGKYVLSAQMRAQDFGSFDRAGWQIACAGATPSAPLLTKTVDLAEKMTLTGALTIPANCPVQLVTVTADTTVRSGYITLILAEAKVSPAR